MHRRPTSAEASPYFFNYIQLVPDDNIEAALEKGKTETLQFMINIPPSKWDFRYAEGKWTIKEVFIHLIDTERIMAYRALRIARNDKTPLSGFEQDPFAENCGAQNRSVESIIAEYTAVRAASIVLFKSFDEVAYSRIGTASKAPASPLSLAYIIAGHEIHHTKVLIERYLG